ncbi:MAG TPA: PEP-CTERM sorting domain-containing protein, partial [Prosthecobacter sp.]|nr:PEP-CTERM sorting domain-containing protein [Prosthecobacter sp.]
VNGTAAIPSGLDYTGEDFLVELYAWGGNGGSLHMDNVILSGECAPIPEPGGALLVACAGFVLMLRRRRR